MKHKAESELDKGDRDGKEEKGNKRKNEESSDQQKEGKHEEGRVAPASPDRKKLGLPAFFSQNTTQNPLGRTRVGTLKDNKASRSSGMPKDAQRRTACETGIAKLFLSSTDQCIGARGEAGAARRRVSAAIRLPLACLISALLVSFRPGGRHAGQTASNTTGLARTLLQSPQLVVVSYQGKAGRGQLC